MKQSTVLVTIKARDLVCVLIQSSAHHSERSRVVLLLRNIVVLQLCAEYVSS